MILVVLVEFGNFLEADGILGDESSFSKNLNLFLEAIFDTEPGNFIEKVFLGYTTQRVDNSTNRSAQTPQM